MADMELKKASWEVLNRKNPDEVRRLLVSHPELTEDRSYMQGVLGVFVRDDELEMVKVFAEFGADIHAPESDSTPEGVICDAARFGAIKVARWLLEQGVQLNFEKDGCKRCLSLHTPAREGNLEMVKLLVEHGADFNATWCGLNSLGFAIANDHHDIVKYLRSKGARTPKELGFVEEPEEPMDSPFFEHLRKFFGDPDYFTLQEIVPTDLPIAIHVIRTDDEQILVTEGMSARPMTVPKGGEKFQYAELVLRLPSDWPLMLEAFENPNNYWPIEWLKRIARYPHDNDSWLGGPHTIIANGEPPEPFAPNTKMSCLMLLANPSEFGRWTRPSDGAEVVFYDVFGLYTEERDLELREGLPALLDRFQSRFISKVLDPQRPNVALKIVGVED